MTVDPKLAAPPTVTALLRAVLPTTVTVDANVAAPPIDAVLCR